MIVWPIITNVYIFNMGFRAQFENANKTSAHIYNRYSIFICNALQHTWCCHFGTHFRIFKLFYALQDFIHFYLYDSLSRFLMAACVQLIKWKYKPKWHWAICMFRANLWTKNGTPRAHINENGRDRPCNKNGDYRRLLLEMLRPIVTWRINACHCIMISVLWVQTVCVRVFSRLTLIFGLFGTLP